MKTLREASLHTLASPFQTPPEFLPVESRTITLMDGSTHANRPSETALVEVKVGQRHVQLGMLTRSATIRRGPDQHEQRRIVQNAIHVPPPMHLALPRGYLRHPSLGILTAVTGRLVSPRSSRFDGWLTELNDHAHNSLLNSWSSVIIRRNSCIDSVRSRSDELRISQM